MTLNSTIKPSTSGPNILSLPIHFLDQRALYFTVTLDSPQADLILESVNLRFGNGIGGLNESSIPLHIRVGKRFIFNSQEFFKLKAHHLPSAESQLSNFSIVYRTTGQAEGTETAVGVAIEVNTIDTTFEPSTEGAFSGPRVEFTHVARTGEGWHSSPSPDDGRLTFSLSKGNSSALLLSSWIPANAEPDRSNAHAQGHLRLSYQGADGLDFPQSGLRVRQIIWGFAKGAYTLEDDLDSFEKVGNYIFRKIHVSRGLLNDRFRVAYLISLEEKLDRRVKVQFEWNFEELGETLPRSTVRERD